MNRIIAIVQARTSSTRLPNKVLEPLGDSCMLIEQVKRMRRSRMLNQIVIATSSESSDDAIEKLCLDHNIDCFRGDLNNVLSRYYHCAVKYSASTVVRVTGDCPLIDPVLIDEVVNYHIDNKSEYTSNCRPATFPDGLDVEIFSFEKLEEAFGKATLPSELEHVSPYIVKNTELLNFENDKDYSKLRVTVDNKEDLDVVRAVYNELSKNNPDFGHKEIINFLLENEAIRNLNSDYMRNEGSLKSLEEDKKFLEEKQ